ncbi:MAG: response regulator [Gemmatimonadaceae bacterium]|nr:response regulator [Gemmatimonadaceae bacterium]
MSENPGGQRHILVADDEPHIGRIIKMKLENGPFRVTLAYDGQEAVDILESHDDIDLVLLDLMMPRKSGMDVLEFVRKRDEWKDLPCIILTAAGEDQRQKDAMKGGATDFLTKPFSPKKLYALVARLTGVEQEAGESESIPGTDA